MLEDAELRPGLEDDEEVWLVRKKAAEAPEMPLPTTQMSPAAAAGSGEEKERRHR